MRTGAPFEAGEICLLLDVRDRPFLVSLEPGERFDFDRGSIDHDDIIGRHEGQMIRSSKGSPLVALRPTLADYVLNMKRGAAVMYPKDAGALITWADIAPGCVVLEAGTGSGALTLALARAVGSDGRVVSVEQRDDHARHARRLIEAFHGSVPANVELVVGDIADHVAVTKPDRIVLDLPEPWSLVGAAVEHLPGGGVLASYVPTVPQMQQLREAMAEAGVFVSVDSFEVMMRSWSVDGRSVRPEHRMVGHTGFITVGRTRVKESRPSSVGGSDATGPA